MIITLPSCHITVTKIDIRYYLQWDARFGTLTSDMPSPAPNGKKEVQAAYTVPTEDATYTLSARGSVYKDSSLKEAGGVINLTSECSATISPVACKLTVDPQSLAMPGKVTVNWETQNTKPGVTLQTVVNNRPVSTTPNPMKPLTVNVTQTTEFVLSVTGPMGEKGSCKGCVLNHPAADKGKLLDIPPLYQGTRMWCWQRPEACADSGGSNWQHVQATLKGYPPAAGRQNGGKANVTKRVSSNFKAGCLSAQEVKAEIDAGRPILALSPAT